MKHLAALLILSSSLANASPQVIGSIGPTESIEPFMAPLNYVDSQHKAVQHDTSIFTVHTPELTPGRIAGRAINLPVLQKPIFLVGADRLSLKWLDKYRNTLIKLGAVGMLVNANSNREVEIMAHHAQGLELSPASGSDLARRFGLTHYPVLITRKRIVQ